MTRFLICHGKGPAANAESATTFARATVESSWRNMLDVGRGSLSSRYAPRLVFFIPRQPLYFRRSVRLSGTH